MNTRLLCMDLLAFSAQTALLIAAGALACALFRLRAPRVRLLFLQALLALSLILPTASIRRAARAPSAAHISVVSWQTSARAAQAGFHVNPFDWIAALAAVGIAARLAWLGLGVVRLQRLRRRAVPVELPPLLSLRRELAVQAAFLVSDDVDGPVAFGLSRPAVLVSPAFLEATPAEQRAIACHELLHLRRKDWLFTLAEEVVRAMFWFHPAVWWLLARIQLTREQVVDREAIVHTRDRDSYLAALLATAAGMVQPDLAPATLFLARRQLAHRIASIQKGVPMSGRRTISALLGAVPMLAVATLAGWHAFPLIAAPQDVAATPGVEVANGFKMLRQTPVEYPQEALARGDVGYVVVSVTLDQNGSVSDAKIVSGPQPLRNAVLSSVLQWRFDPNQTLPPDRTFEIGVRFTPPSASGNGEGTLAAIDVTALPSPLREEAFAVAGPVGRQYTAKDLGDLSVKLRRIDRGLNVSEIVEKNGSLELTITYSASDSADAPKRIRVGGGVQAMNRIAGPIPAYPPEAKEARIQGTVRFNAVIGADGHVKGLTVLSGHPLLVPSATDAVRQWVYRPTLLNGNPVEVLTSIEVNYSLQE